MESSNIMDFNPQNLSVFQEKGPKTDPNIYKTNPKDSKADDGVYRSKVKLLYNPLNFNDSVVNQATYWLNRMDGSRPVRSSLSDGNKQCPLFVGWKSLWFSGDDAKKDFSKKVYQKNESQWVLVQVLEDENKPEMVGKFKYMKLAKDIFEKFNARTNPSPSSGKTSYPVLDYVIGLALDLEVQPGPDDPKAPERKQREISYSLSNFGDYATIIKTDGTPLLTDEEAELVDTYVTAINDSQNGKTAKKKQDGAAKIAEIKPQIVPIYEKVMKYVQENAVDAVTGEPMDLKKYCGFTPWDEETARVVSEFVEMTSAMVDPQTMTYAQFKAGQTATAAPAGAVETPVEVPSVAPAQTSASDLPF